MNFFSMFSTEFSLKVGVFTEFLNLIKSGLHFVLKNGVKHRKIFKVNSEIKKPIHYLHSLGNSQSAAESEVSRSLFLTQMLFNYNLFVFTD